MSLNVAWIVSRFTYMYQIFHFVFSRCLKVSCNDWNRYKLKQIMFPVSFNAISQHLHIMHYHAALDINLVEFFETYVADLTLLFRITWKPSMETIPKTYHGLFHLAEFQTLLLACFINYRLIMMHVYASSYLKTNMVCLYLKRYVPFRHKL